MTTRKALPNLIGALSLGLGLVFLLLVGTQAMGQKNIDESITLTRGPYLQSVTTDSIIIVWETEQPASSRVDYGPTAAYGLVVSDSVNVTHRALVLTNLNPYTTYHYQISSNGQLLGEGSAFRTAASPTQTTFSFVALGDTRTNYQPHQSVISRAVMLSPDFFLHTGDFVEDGSVAAQWDTFFEIEQDLLRQSPLFGALGGHEKNDANYFDAFHLPGNEHWYSFDYGDAHFIALQVDHYADYTPGSPQYAWLENDLANTDRLWKFVFFHNPPYSSGSHGSDLAVRDALGPLFTQHNVDLVFNGHDHDYERSVVTDVVYIVTGGGGAPLHGQANSNPYSVHFASTYHCVSITINNRILSSVGVRPDGVQFDAFTISKPLDIELPLAAFDSSSPDWLGQATIFTNTSIVSETSTYLWTFGDGATSTLTNPSHTYAVPGSYTATLTATTAAKSDVATDTVIVYSPPSVDFTAHPTQGVRLLNIAFTAIVTTTPSGDPALTYLWDFGDGKTSDLEKPKHVYRTNGIYTVALKVSNPAGSDTTTKTEYITIREGYTIYLSLILRSRYTEKGME
jgi:hypothetical protein